MDAVFFHVGDEKALSYNCCTPRAAPPVPSLIADPLPDIGNAFVSSSFLRRGIVTPRGKRRGCLVDNVLSRSFNVLVLEFKQCRLNSAVELD